MIKIFGYSKLFILVLLFLCSFNLLPEPAEASNKVFSSGSTQVNTIELYSSEGCSSCPPADRWLASLRSEKNLWKGFIPINFHVDYWDQLGWIDKLAHSSFTGRQRQFAREWNNRSVYTPGLALNGKEFRSRDKKFLHFKEGTVGPMQATQLQGHKFRVQFRPTNKKLKSPILYGALLGNGLVTKVKAGENAGETLRHEFVVLDLEKVALTQRGDELVAEVELRRSSNVKPKSYSVAFWVSVGGSLKPIQAVGGDL